MNGCEYVYVRRKWLEDAFKMKRREAVKEMVDAILRYAYDEPMPRLSRQVEAYFEREIRPVIDAQRMDWRQFDRRKALFDDVMGDIPDEIREDFEKEFMSHIYHDEPEFQEFLDTTREMVNFINTAR